jgi:glycerate dehydrogenase
VNGVFLDLDTVAHQGDVDLAPLRATLATLEVHGVTPAAALAARIASAEIVLTNKCALDAAAFAAAPRLRLVCLAATGHNNVDLAAARAHGVAVCNIRAYCTPGVVQHVFMLLLAHAQRLDGYRAMVAARAWERAPQFTLLDLPIHELAGRTLGVIGWGELGRAVAKVAAAFGMRVLVAERKPVAGAASGALRPGRTPFDQVLAESDYLTLHCPLDASTRGLIGATELARMKPTAVLINTARGAVVDEAALAAALRAGRLGGAGIDVLSQEPPIVVDGKGNPLLEPGIPNLIVTPHVAWAAVEARQRAIEQMAACIAAFRRGERMNRVD